MSLLKKSKLALGYLLAGVRQKLVGAHVEAFLVATRNGRLLVPSLDLGVGKDLAFRGEYDWEKLERLFDTLRAEDKVLVVGGHVGAVAIPVSKRSKMVHIVEANPRTADLLQFNLQINEALNCVLHRFAAGARDGEMSFLMSAHNTGGSKLVLSEAVLDRWEYTYDHPDMVAVPVKSLDHALGETRFDVVVMDVEGAEYQAMQGMRQILCGARVFLVEVIPNHLRDMAGLSVRQFLSEIWGFGFNRALVLSEGAAVEFGADESSRLAEEIVRSSDRHLCDVIFLRCGDRIGAKGDEG